MGCQEKTINNELFDIQRFVRNFEVGRNIDN